MRGGANYASARSQTNRSHLNQTEGLMRNFHVKIDESIELKNKFHEDKRLAADSPAHFVTDKSTKKVGNSFRTMKSLNMAKVIKTTGH